MMNSNTPVKAGRFLCVDHGEYSDYRVLGFFVVLREFIPGERLEAYLTGNKEDSHYKSFRADAFLASLISQGLLLELKYSTLFMGCYHSHSDVRFDP